MWLREEAAEIGSARLWRAMLRGWYFILKAVGIQRAVLSSFGNEK